MADGVTRIDLDKGHEVIFDDDGARTSIPATALSTSRRKPASWVVLPDGGTPD